MDYRKLKAETCEDPCPFTVAVFLTPAREYFYLQRINTLSLNISNLREFGKAKLFY